MFAPNARAARWATIGLMATLLSSPALARERSTTFAPDSPRPEFVVHDESTILHGGRAPWMAKAATDSFNLYGGVRSDGSNDRRPEGQFQDFILFPLDQGWVGVDRTENPTFWNVSTFNAPTLDAGQVDNRAMWSGVPATTPGFVSAPGYGNNWNDVLQWTAETNPTLNTTVDLDFVFHHDTEPGYDFFIVEYDSAGTWVEMLAIDGSNKDASNQFVTPVTFDQSVVFTPLMYTGTQNPPRNIRLRMRVLSDGAWSDEDGLWPTRGAVQVDNVTVRFNGALVTQNGDDGIATFEDLGGIDDTEGWAPVSAAFAGDFSKVLPQLRDIDPCRTNLTPQLGFVDDGTPPKNDDQDTGGSLSPNWSYGVRGGWVVNYTGGVSFGLVPLNNEFWSPEIAWDDTSTTEDDNLTGGAFFRFTVWQHLPLNNGIFWVWSVRSEKNGDWTPWRNRNFVYYGDGGGAYSAPQFDVSDLLVSDPERVQIALGVNDLADVFGFPGNDATPSPAFDNVSFWRYDLAGPAFATRNIDLFQDGFPNSGTLDLNNPTSLSVRMDMARDISTGTAIIPGDSMIVDVTPQVPGTDLAGIPVLKWSLEANPLFDGVRSLPAGAVNEGPGTRGWNRWTGTVQGDSSRTSSGVAVSDRFFFDLPNDGPANANAPHQANEDAMFFPGDRIRYFIEATDTAGNVSTLPADTTGFYGTGGYSRTFTVRALPSVVQDGAGTAQPDILVVNDFGHRGGENDWVSAFDQLGMAEDVDYEVYTTRGPSSLVSNGIGSAGAHGATPQQLEGYPVLLYLSGDLSDGLISDGTNENGNDKGNDVDVLTQWHELPGDRFIAYWGDNLSSFLAGSGAAGQTYLSTVMGVNVVDDDVRDEIDNNTSPIVRPIASTGLSFVTEFVAYGGCLGINQFDSITPLPAAISSHEFMDQFGTVFTPSAGVWYDRTQQVNAETYRRVDLTFPYDFSFLYQKVGETNPGGISTRTLVLGEVLQAFGQATNPGAATDVGPTPRRFEVFENVPNPFNPVTNIRFAAPTAGQVAIRIYNVRGELVRVLLDGEVAAGEHMVTWDGTDDRGAEVSSGVYLYEVAGFGQRSSHKMALLK